MAEDHFDFSNQDPDHGNKLQSVTTTKRDYIGWGNVETKNYKPIPQRNNRFPLIGFLDSDQGDAAPMTSSLYSKDFEPVSVS